MVTTASGAVRLKNNGRLLPAWIDTKTAEAVRGTAQLRRIDSNLTVGWDARRHTYTVFGPSISAGGWVALCDCQDDEGRPYRGQVPWPLIVQALVNARDGELACDAAARHNDAYASSIGAAESAELREALLYAHRAIQADYRGAGRHRPEDVVEGFLNARDGRSKMRPRGRKTFFSRE